VRMLTDAPDRVRATNSHPIPLPRRPRRATRVRSYAPGPCASPFPACVLSAVLGGLLKMGVDR
jgi:hypothetical protein